MKKVAKSSGASLEQAMPSPSKMGGPIEKQDPIDSYEVKDHLDTLMKAHGIMNDPEKMAKVHKLAGRHANAIKGIQDIKDHYNLKYGGKNAGKNLGDLSGKESDEGE